MKSHSQPQGKKLRIKRNERRGGSSGAQARGLRDAGLGFVWSLCTPSRDRQLFVTPGHRSNPRLHRARETLASSLPKPLKGITQAGGQGNGQKCPKSRLHFWIQMSQGQQVQQHPHSFLFNRPSHRMMLTATPGSIKPLLLSSQLPPGHPLRS